ncbi:MAG: hypothetical protein RR626_03545 [Anaerovoracaceae bacterium]
MKERVITIVGATAEVGTTMIAQSIAEELSKENKVLFIMASSNTGLDYLNYDGKAVGSLDDLRTAIEEKALRKREVEGILITDKGMQVLPPIKDLIKARYYNATTLEDIHVCIGADYDYLVIDGGGNVQMPLCVASLCVTDMELYVVVTQQEKMIKRYREFKENVMIPLELQGKVIVNRYLSSPAFPGLKQLEGRLQEKNLFPVGYSEYGWQAELDKESLMKYPKYREGIKAITEEIQREG